MTCRDVTVTPALHPVLLGVPVPLHACCARTLTSRYSLYSLTGERSNANGKCQNQNSSEDLCTGSGGPDVGVFCLATAPIIVTTEPSLSLGTAVGTKELQLPSPWHEYRHP